MTVLNGAVRIKPTKPAKPGIFFDLDDNETISGGAGGWESLERPRTSPATAWVATPARQLEVPLSLDGRDVLGPGLDQVVEGMCRRLEPFDLIWIEEPLERWGLPLNKTGEPAILRVDGLPRVDGAKRWVIQDITWGAYLVDDAGQRVYQQLTLVLLEYVAAELVKSPAKRARKRQRAKRKQGSD